MAAAQRSAGRNPCNTAENGTAELHQAASLKDWVGRSRKAEDEVYLGAVRRMAAMLDQDPGAYTHESPIPESWYVILFGPTALQSAIGPDGHASAGEFLPPLAGARRMFGGRRTRFSRPLRVGDRVERISTITRADVKHGRRGPFTLISLVHEINAASDIAVTEQQDLIFRPPATDAASSPAVGNAEVSSAVELEPEWSRAIVPDTVLLFRYSALTFNAHRIHYDLPYARDVEAYPALVMNGGLTALLLVEAARPHLARRIAGYDARAMRPLFVGERMTLNGRRHGDAAELWACGPDGARAYHLDVLLDG
jgi:3-methylfumaryl-CoA hydratase